MALPGISWMAVPGSPLASHLAAAGDGRTLWATCADGAVHAGGEHESPKAAKFRVKYERASAAMEAVLADKALQDILLAHLGHHYRASRIGTELGPTAQRGWPHAAGLLPTVGGTAPELVAQLPLTLSVLWASATCEVSVRPASHLCWPREVQAGGWERVILQGGGSTVLLLDSRTVRRLGDGAAASNVEAIDFGPWWFDSSVLDDGSLARRNADAALPIAAELVPTRGTSALVMGDHDPALLDLFEHWPAAASTEVARL